jgi:CelD/BcsL family acetyltransferase involved in cellulose biosynthesis
MTAPDSLLIREWTLAEWMAGESSWSALLEKSGLDPLFLSWTWMTTWWQFFGADPAKSLCILAAYRGKELVGIAPMYRARVRRAFLPARSLQFIGILWRDPGTMISEYLDFIAVPADRAVVRKEFLRHLTLRRDWSELVVCYTSAGPEWTRAFEDAGMQRSGYWRVIESSTSYQADLSAGFGQYLAGLGQSTRRSLWHLRRRLGSPAEVRLEQVPGSDLDAAFADFNRLHTLRWGESAFGGKRLGFHRGLAADLARRGELRMSRLWVGARLVSMLYDIRKGSNQYNIKMAFDPSVEQQYSLGLIHFGFAMEAAAAEGVRSYDFLAGRGLKTDYKSHLGQRSDELATVHLTRGALLPRLYRWYDSRMNNAGQEIA